MSAFFNAGQAIFTIDVRKSAFEQGLQQATATVKTATQRITQDVDKMGGELVRIGTLINTSLSLPLKRMAASFIEQSSAAEQLEAKFRASLTNMADDAMDFSMRMRNNLGLSLQEVKNYTTELFNMTRAMGFTGQQAMAMSQALTQVAFDFAAFFDVQPEVAFQRVRAGIVGEPRPLRRWGIQLLDTIVKEKALEMGVAAANEELTQQQKVLVRLALITGQIPAAMNALEREQHTYQVSTFRLNAAIQELQITLGDAILPAMTTFTRLLTRWLRSLRTVVDVLNTLNPLWGYFFAILGGILVILPPILVNLGLMAMGLNALLPILKSLTAWWTAMWAAATLPISTVVAGLAIIAGLLIGMVYGFNKVRGLTEEQRARVRHRASDKTFGMPGTTDGVLEQPTGFDPSLLNVGPGIQVSSGLIGAGLSRETLGGLAQSLQIGTEKTGIDRQNELTEETNTILRDILTNAKQRQVDRTVLN